MTKNVLIVAPMESNGRSAGGIMTVANTLSNNADSFAQYGISVGKFNTYIRTRKAESIGKVDFNNILNMVDIMKGLLKETKSSRYATLYYHTSIKTALLKDLLVIRVLRLFRRKQRIVLHIHFAEIEKIIPANKLLHKWMLKMIQKYVNHTIFLSKNTKEEFVAEGISEDKASVIYNFHAESMTEDCLREKCNLCETKEKTELLFMGSIEQRKGILDLLSAIRSVRDRCILHVCGVCTDDTIAEKFEKKIANYPECVIYHGFVAGKNRKELLKVSDCLVLPSYGEGFPLVLVEAMANGCACIATPVGAVSEFFDISQNGYLFDPGDVRQLEENLVKICDDRKSTARQMKNNFDFAKKFTVERFIESLCGVL